MRPRMMTCSLLNQTKVHTSTNQKALHSYGSSTGWESAALLGLARISWSIHPVWTQTVLTKANALLLLKEVGSHGEDSPDVSIPVHPLRSYSSKVLGERTDQHMHAGLLFIKSCDLHMQRHHCIEQGCNVIIPEDDIEML